MCRNRARLTAIRRVLYISQTWEKLADFDVFRIVALDLFELIYLVIEHHYYKH